MSKQEAVPNGTVLVFRETWIDYFDNEREYEIECVEDEIFDGGELAPEEYFGEGATLLQDGETYEGFDDIGYFIIVNKSGVAVHLI